MSPPSDRPLTRRTTLRGAALAAGALATAGCSTRIHVPGGDLEAPQPQTPEAQRADIDLANRLVGELGVSIALLRGTVLDQPPLGARLRPVLAAQRAQRAVLRKAIPKGERRTFTPDRPRVPSTRAAALTRATAGVTAQRDSLLAAAGTARAGELARVLASAAAGLSQHLSTLAVKGAG